MAKKKELRCPYVCLYESYMETLAPFTDAERGRLITAMLEYMYTGKEPEFTGNERYIWPSLKGQIDRDKEAYKARCDANRENGKKGGRPKTQKTQGFFSEPKKPKEKEKENEKEKEKENEKENDNGRETEKETESLPAAASPEAAGHAPFSVPTTYEIMSYCDQEGYQVDPWRFRDYYEAIGWKLGNTPIRDWRPLVRRWSEPEEHIPGCINYRDAAGEFGTEPVINTEYG